MDDWITLRVGGRICQTTRATLTADHGPNSKLAKMFSSGSSSSPPRDREGASLIDVDPDSFGIILNWLRHKEMMNEYVGGLINKPINPISVSIVARHFNLTNLEQFLNKDGQSEINWLRSSLDLGSLESTVHNIQQNKDSIQG